jgi:diguanylate cyclase (GGDEF)-like protein
MAPPVPGAWWSSAFAIGGVAATVLYAVDVSTAISGVAFAIVGIGCVTALLVGPRWHRAEPRAAWSLLTAASAAFLVGALLRPWAVSQQGATVLVADAFTVPGYLFGVLWLVGLLRARGGVDRHAVVDGLIVCLGAGLAATLLLAVPAGSVAGRPAAVSTLAAIYPFFDVLVVLLLANLAFTTAARRPAYLLLMAGLGLVLVGDLQYAVAEAGGGLSRSATMDLPFLLAYTAIGASVLHPSVAALGRAAPVPVQAWSWPRLMVILPALAIPFALIPLVADRSPATRLVLALGGAAAVGLLVVRAVSAVRDYATAQLRYEHQATHDRLTGLPNRWLLSTQLTRMLAAGQPAAGEQIWVFFLDLDGFKLVNDSWGHEAGDQMIVEVARRLRRTVPPTAMLARVGGDEFVLVHCCTRSAAVGLVQAIMAQLAEPLPVGGSEAIISASIGVASAPAVPAGPAPATTPTSPAPATVPASPAAASADVASEPVTAESLMRDADIAMYQAKSEGRGRCTFFDASMHERVRERVEIELALRQAMARGELHLAYQPIVELTTARLVGAEALIRWDHPVRGSVPPCVFIPIAEDNGLVTAIGSWVLREAVSQLAAWRAAGAVDEDFWMSVNVSPRQLRDISLPSTFADALTAHQVPATAVVLEITESVMVDTNEVTEGVLFELRSMGARIVVDDFGTGFSSLNYLRRHPVTGVKIDRGFVAGLGAKPEDEAIVRAVVAMSTALGLTIVAEGVETRSQRDILAGMGIVHGQGQLWGLPVGPHHFTERHATKGQAANGQAVIGSGASNAQ